MISNQITRAFFFILILIACVTSHYWINPLSKVLQLNLFLTPEALWAFAFSLFLILLAPRLIPEITRKLFSSCLHCINKCYRIYIIAALICIFALFLWINQNVLLTFLNSADEHSCWFAAKSLLLGKWYVGSPELSEFFNVVHVGNRDGKWFSVYPPGWPALWATGIALGIGDFINPALTCIGLLLLYLSLKRIYGNKVSAIAIVLMASAPFFSFTAASYFSHSTCFLTVSGFIYCYLRWQSAESDRARIFWATLCGFTAGYGLLTRYLTTGALIAPFVIDRVLAIIKQKRIERGDIAFSIVIIVMMGFVLYHNYAITGKPFRAPNKYDKSWERLGFKGDYSIIEGIRNIFFRLFYLSDWAPSIWVVLFAYITASKHLFENKFQRIIHSLFWWNAWAYFLYFSWGGNQYGPRYYYESFPFLIVSCLQFVKRQWSSGNPAIQKRCIAFGLCVIFVTFYQYSYQVPYYQEHTRQRKALYSLASDKLDQPSIVFIHGPLGTTWPLSQDDAIRNSPDLSGKILYALDRGEDNQRLMGRYPDRKAFLGSFNRATLQAELVPLT